MTKADLERVLGVSVRRGSVRVGSAIAVGTAWLMGGCVDINSRATIGADRALPAFASASVIAETEDVATTRLDRGDWEPVVYRVPVDGVVHAPLWTSEGRFSDAQRRQHGLYPTAESALDLGAPGGEQVMGGFVEPVRVLADVFLMPVRWVIDPAWDLEQSPSMYKRWHSGVWYAGPMPEAGGAAGFEGDPAGGGS